MMGQLRTSTWVSALSNTRTSSIEPVKYGWPASLEKPMLIPSCQVKLEAVFVPLTPRTPST
jgi:hypothetical protein